LPTAQEQANGALVVRSQLGSRQLRQLQGVLRPSSTKSTLGIEQWEKLAAQKKK